MIVEQLLEQGKVSWPEMQQVRKAAKDGKDALVEIFFVIQKHNKRQIEGEENE